MTPIFFYIAFISIMGMLNYYVYVRMIRKMHFNFNRLALLGLGILFFLQMLFVLEARFHLFTDTPSLYYLLSMSVGITAILFFSALFYDLLHSVGQRIPYNQHRRYFIKIMFDATMIILAMSYLFNGILGGLRRPAFKSVNVGIKGLEFQQFTIAQISDLHIGRTIGTTFVRECVERINAQHPDMVVLTGDIIDLPITMVREAVNELSRLKSRYGTYFVLGNHEYFRGPEAIIKHLKSLGIQVLLNDSVRIGEGSQAFNLVGINDLFSQRAGILPYDVEKAFRSIDHDLPTIVLAHQPKTLHIVQHQSYDLMLSGHTHGGQIFPFGFLVMLDQPYLSGLHRFKENKQIYVSRGTGYWGPPVRVLAPNEISLITLYPV